MRQQAPSLGRLREVGAELSIKETLIKQEPPLWCGYVNQKLAESKPPGASPRRIWAEQGSTATA
jgi:hypothetical protein